MLEAVRRIRERARECVRFGNRGAAAHLETVARELERDIENEPTDPNVMAICVNCGHPTPCCHVPPRG